jgi:hypothetical protein
LNGDEPVDYVLLEAVWWKVDRIKISLIILFKDKLSKLSCGGSVDYISSGGGMVKFSHKARQFFL